MSISYNTIKTMKGTPIGGVMPWTGPLTKIPKGWLLCNGAELNSSDYPLLARVLKSTYGGTNFDGTFPNYEGTFNLPNLNQKCLADIYTDYFSDNVNDNPPIVDIDSEIAFSIVSEYIGEETDLGPPSSVVARTDLNFEYTPDNNGAIAKVEVAGTGATTTGAIYLNLSGTTTGDGTDALFTIARSSAGTYSAKIVNKGKDYVVDDTITITGDKVGGSTPTNDVTITVKTITNSYFEGTITGQKLLTGTGTEPVYVVPRKLGRNHFPSHQHPDSFRTINKNDSTTNPGTGVGVFDTVAITIRRWHQGIWIEPFAEAPIQDPIDGGPFIGEIWGDYEGEDDITTPYDVSFATGYGRYAIGAVIGTRPARYHVPLRTESGAHGIGKSWFNEAKNLRTAAGTSTVAGNTALTRLKDGSSGYPAGVLLPNDVIPFSDDTAAITTTNYDSGGNGSDNAVSVKEVLFNTPAISFTKTTPTSASVTDVIESHDHEGEFSITYDKGSLKIDDTITVKLQPDGITPDNLPGAFQITFTILTPTLAVTNLIRAY